MTKLNAHRVGERYGVGVRLARVEDERFLRGEGRYGDDVNLDGQAHAALVLSPVAAGRLRGVDADEARAMPGVIGVYTIDDLDADGVGDLPCPIAAALEREDGSPAYHPPRPLLARDAVRYAGDPIALVVAETDAIAREAAEMVVADIEERPAVTDPVAALEGGPTVWGEASGNVAFVKRVGDAGATDAAFERAAHVAAVTIPFPRLAMSPMEPRTALGEWDGERFTLHSGTQNPHQLAPAMSAVLGVEASAVRFSTPDMGGAFGMRAGLSPEMGLVLWAARHLGRPVKWRGTRSEAFLTDEMGRDLSMTAELALDAEGGFLALRAHSSAAMGAYLSQLGPLPSFVNLGGLTGVYRVPHMAVEVRGAFTNAPPVGPYRGAGRPEATACIELAIEEAARITGIDRAALRTRNRLRPDAMPYATPLGWTYDSGDFPAVMAAVHEAADVAGFDARRTASEARGMRRGLGLISSIESAASAGGERAGMRVAADGRLTLALGSVNHGQGHETVMRQLVAERLGIAPDMVDFAPADTDLLGGGTGSFGSRTAALGGSATWLAGEAIERRGAEIAATMMGASADDVVLEEGRFVVPGTNFARDWAEVAREAAARDGAWEVELSYAAERGPTFPNGAHACEVEIDPETGVIRVERYHAVLDVGTVLNPMLVEGQLHGGIAQGLGEALMECMVYDDDTGGPVTGSFMDYAMPRADDMPSIGVDHAPCPTERNPLGAKGAGEAGTVGALSATLAAVNDALVHAGAGPIDMPATPERVWGALRTLRDGADTPETAS